MTFEARKYWIYEVGNGPDPLGDAKRFGYPAESRFGPDDALEAYMKECDSYSHFVDGYPNNIKYCVVDTETGEETIWFVEAEFEPRFYAYKG